MMSSTAREGISIKHMEKTPSSQAYKIELYNTISNPMISGGAPNNPLTMIRFKNFMREKSQNPFKVSDLDLRENGRDATNLGPG